MTPEDNAVLNEIIAKMSDLGIKMELKAWNAAIQAALAKVCDAFGSDSGIADEIRELKK